MSSVEPEIRKAFEALDTLQGSLSVRWREHTNRRTIIVLIVGGAVLLTTYLFAIRPPNQFPIGELVPVESGQSVTQMAITLREMNVVRSAFMFRALVTVLGTERSIRAGDYVFKEPVDVFRVARSLSVGAFGLEPTRIRVPEGANTREMASIFESQLVRFDKDSFIEKSSLYEGYLFPDTYFFLPNANENTVLDTLRQNFEVQMETLRPLIASSTRSLDEIVTMASIIEKEARNSADRRKISSVLWNRMDRNMALQVDVTFLYTIGKGTFELTKDDLASESPYNTYVNKGLPPTPICSPSIDAIRAALQPDRTDFLYFMADHSGVTHFCKSYACHLANKARYY